MFQNSEIGAGTYLVLIEVIVLSVRRLVSVEFKFKLLFELVTHLGNCNNSCTFVHFYLG